MALGKNIEVDISVVEAAEQRIKNVYANGTKVYISFSGGKDSICVIGLVYNLMKRGEINPSQTTVVFIDEEGMYDCIIENVMLWRRRMMAIGCEFQWYCMEYKHYNCLNSLVEDESFICWDRYKRDRWIRPMPKFAITSHPLFKPRKMTYQQFLDRLHQDGITLIGLRSAESLRRSVVMKKVAHKGNSLPAGNTVYPIYDWKDGDVFKYILDNGLELPEVYQFLWEIGLQKNKLRVSQFFSIDTARSLATMNEYYPDLMQRVERREPNAYLVSLYYDSEMFRRSTSNRRKLEDDEPEKDYKAMLMDVFRNPRKYFKDSKVALRVVERYKRAYLKMETQSPGAMENSDYRKMYESVIAGDPKLRNLQALQLGIRKKYSEMQGGR